MNLLALSQHQHTSFLCPDVSDRIALLFQGTFKKSSLIKDRAILSEKNFLEKAGQSCPKRRDKENSCAGAEGELKD